MSSDHMERGIMKQPGTQANADGASTRRVAAGKRPRTASLSVGPAVQRKTAPAGRRLESTMDTSAALGLADWTDVAFRPDVHSTPASSSMHTGPVQTKSSGASPANDTVHNAAASGVSGSGGAMPFLDNIQSSFGNHDISGVRAHTGKNTEDACETMGAQAYATGNDVAFARTPDLHTAAHEVAHVVQQRAGVSLSEGVGQHGDSYERNADAVADAVVAGRSAESLLGPVVSSAPADTSVQGKAVQRFESNEHKMLGDEGSRTDQGQTRTVEVAPDYFLSFGDVTAMAGDFFGSVDEIRRLAARTGTGADTREEIEYVKTVKVQGHEDQEDRFSQAARDAVMARYYRLAGNNSSHFTEPNGVTERTSLNNAGNYRDNHENAIRLAAQAGASGGSIDNALLCEGFASHFLTDAYAAGHVRTERISISDWWNPKVPMFWTNLQLYICEQMAIHINDNTNLAGTFQTVQQLWETVREMIGDMDLPTLTFGDLVSGAVHDYDNEKGVQTQHGLLMGDGGLLDATGAPVAHDDPALQQAAQNTRSRAIAAVQISLAEVERAFQMGSSMAEDQVLTTLCGNDQYAAEAIWPQASPQSQQPNARPQWQQPDVATLVANATMREALEIFAREKADSLEEALAFEDVERAGITVVSAEVQSQGFRTRITEPLRSNPVATLQAVIDYTPNTGGGVAGHDTDDNAMEYIGMARSQDAMSTLTRKQRIDLIQDMVPGSCGDDEEQAIIDLLSTTSTSEMTEIVRALGDNDVEEGIDYLDSGVDGAEWRTLKELMRRSSTLREYL